MMNLFKKAFYNWYYIRNIQQDDVLLASYPKSGNTWVAFLMANLQREAHGITEEVNFLTIPNFIPETTAPWGAIPKKKGSSIRIIKTHACFQRPFRRVIWLVRDPRKVMASYYLYQAGMNLLPAGLDYEGFVRDPEQGIDAWKQHTMSYLRMARPNRGVYLFRYEDLLADPEKKLGEISRLLGLAELNISLRRICERCNRENMRQLEKETRRSGINDRGDEEYDFVGKNRSHQDDEWVHSYILERAGGIMREIGYPV